MITFAGVDWGMSLDPHWYSTIWGILFMVGQALSAVLSEIDQTARATFASITLATMLALIERQQRAAADARPRARQ